MFSFISNEVLLYSVDIVKPCRRGVIVSWQGCNLSDQLLNHMKMSSILGRALLCECRVVFASCIHFGVSCIGICDGSETVSVRNFLETEVYLSLQGSYTLTMRMTGEDGQQLTCITFGFSIGFVPVADN